MALDTSLKEKMRKITSKAALAASKFKGLNDKIGADKAAVDIMRAELNDLNINGRVVIGEGELDEAPMLYICLLYTSPSPRDNRVSRMPSSA